MIEDKQLNDLNSIEINQYLEAAIQFSRTQRTRDFAAGNKYASVLERVGKELRETETGQRALLDLLNHDDLYVRIWSAKDCLYFCPDASIPVLEDIKAEQGLLGTTARMTLSEWEAGQLFNE